ncbi:type II and III secretion system protein family protein [Granulosicoccus antarcticus]|uniref:Type II secretion system protein D n=1 Tax=Granulosicoccus antarcticus IMCC3135 TaxID=1192854 RepID=A0A2Z2P490_9GAMM|nr:pilus assembly protein N-terminal domain-containing protein [Granulosicoccus antarcticus]ASJ74654.1 Putative type II secretion system protein D [Granulosicoccus antarcticus IMCC3135]
MRTTARQWVSFFMGTVLALSSGPIVHADDNDGWFEVTSGSKAQPVEPLDSLPVEPMDSSWQAVTAIAPLTLPLVRTERPIREKVAFKPEPVLMETPTRTLDDSEESVLPVTEAQLAAARQQRRNQLAASSVSTINVDMFAGEVKVLGQVEVTRVAVGNGDIVRAEVLKTGELLVIAQSEGSTSLRLWHSDQTQSDFNIRVSTSDPETRIRMETMVRMHVRMIEFRKSALGKLGIDWSDSTAGPGFAIAGDAIGNNLYRLPSEGFAADLPNTVQPFSTYFGIASSLTSRINFMASTGDATTLAEPVLSTTSGGTASFLAGGEVPYPSVGANGQTVVQFKEYGIKLNVSPSIDAQGNVRTLVETEISQLDPAVSVQGAPGLLTRKAQTQVNVRSGETIVISGLMSAESSKDIDKLPGIGNLPIIGGLFRSQNARNAVSELVIFVTPEIVEPSSTLMNPRERKILNASDERVELARQQIPLLD